MLGTGLLGVTARRPTALGTSPSYDTSRLGRRRRWPGCRADVPVEVGATFPGVEASLLRSPRPARTRSLRAPSRAACDQPPPRPPRLAFRVRPLASVARDPDAARDHGRLRSRPPDGLTMEASVAARRPRPGRPMDGHRRPPGATTARRSPASCGWPAGRRAGPGSAPRSTCRRSRTRSTACTRSRRRSGASWRSPWSTGATHARHDQGGLHRSTTRPS